MTKDENDPWAGWPETPWEIDGYSLDDAICDHIAQCQTRYDGIYFETGEEALTHLLERVRARRYDKKD